MSEDELSYGEKIAAYSDLTIYCAPCNRRVEFDPTNIVESKRPLGRRFRCALCGEYGQCIASPKWRPNSIGEMIPYGTPPISHSVLTERFIGPPRKPALNRRRRRR